MSLIESFTNCLEFISIYTETYIYPACLFVFMKACRGYNILNDYCIDIYESNDTVRIVVDHVQYKITSAYSFMINRKMEPNELHWFSTSWLTLNNKSLTRYYNYNEEYANFFTKYFCNDLFEFYPGCQSGYAVKYLESISNDFIQRHPNVLFPLLVIKTLSITNRAFYIVRNASSQLAPFLYKKSCTRFISIEYTHPEMVESIEIKLDDGFYISGNELFGPAFVMRLLEHQSSSYFFDTRYKIRILDSDCSMIDFGFETHLLLTSDGYTMVVNEMDGYMGSSEEDVDVDVNPLVIDPSIDLGSLYTPFEFGFRR